ncbi:MAG: class II fructose-bisphosphate aldolase [Halanaerobiales bacterium]|nr:class II fructose-bisphosphate aldolase [Halanaerobiales bacterium]
MGLVNLNEILKPAQRSDYAVGAFNVYNIEDITAVLKAAEESNSPVILMTSNTALKHSNVKDLAAIITRRAQEIEVPVCLHLDHANDFETMVKAIDAGYTSVMFDGSSLSYDINVEKTQEIVKVAHSLGVTVEAEIGRVGKSEEGDEDFETILSVPNEVKSFVNDTDIDACAIAIGTQHGMQTQAAEIDFQRLSKIRDLVEVPLVLHGSSGVKDEELKIMGKKGIQKVNIGTRLKRVFTDTLRDKLSSNKNLHNHITALSPCIDEVSKEVKYKMKMLGCNRKA